VSTYGGRPFITAEFFGEEDPSMKNKSKSSAAGGDDMMKMLEDGWSSLTVVAKKAAQVSLEGAKVESVCL
jgi:hypothetical protein